MEPETSGGVPRPPAGERSTNRARKTLSRRYREACDDAGIDAIHTVAVVLGAALYNECQSLSFEDQPLEEAQFECILSAIDDCTVLRRLSFANTQMPNSIGARLTEVALSLPNLRTLDLRKNPGIGRSAGNLMMKLSVEHRRIRQILLHGTGVGAPMQELVSSHCSENAERDDRLSKFEPSEPRPPSTDGSSFASSPRGRALLGATANEETSGALARLTDPSKPPPRKKFAGHIGLLSLAVDAETAVREDLIDSNRKWNGQRWKRVIDDEDELLALVGHMLDRTEKWQAELGRKGDTVDSSIVTVVQTWRAPCVKSEVPRQEIVQEGDLIVPLSELKAMLSLYTPRGEQGSSSPSVAAVSRHRGAKEADPSVIQQNDQQAERGAEEAAKVAKRLLREMAEAPITIPQRKETLLRELRETMRRTGLDGLPNVEELLDIFAREADALETDRKQVESTDPRLVQLRLRRDKANTERASHKKAGRYKESERAHEESISVQEEMLELVQLRLRLLRDPSKRADLSATLERLVEEGQERVARVTANARVASESADRDITRLDEIEKEKQERMEQRQRDMEATCENLSSQLQTNTQRQQIICKEIAERLADLQNVCQERVTILSNYMADRERYESANEHHYQFCLSKRDQATELHEVRRGAQAARPPLEELQGFYRTIQEAINQASAESRDRLATIRSQELLQHLEVFKQYFNDAGDLIYHLDKRHEEVQREYRNVEFKSEYAHETLDPNSSRYKSSLSDLEAEEESLRSRLRTLKGRADIADQEFNPTAEQLKAEGVRFDHPRLTYQEEAVKWRKEALATKKKMQEVENRTLEDSDDDLQVTAQVVAHAKSKGDPEVISPLSSNKKRPKMDSRGGWTGHSASPASATATAAPSPRSRLVFA